MAESLISIVLNQLAKITVQKVQLVRGVDAEIKKLTRNLQAIQAVLEDAEKRQMKEANVKLWLEDLKDVSCDIDDVLDEWNTAILKQEAEKVWSPCTLSSGLCFLKVCLRHGIATKIKELNVSLADIANRKNAYNFIPGRGSQEPKLLTSSVIDVSEVFGREQDTNHIKSMLLSGNGEGATLRIISVVGMGGLGKTTLARLAFNDAQVDSHFDKRIWVCVSDPFDERRIAIEILESLGKNTNLVGIDNILKEISAGISEKKILLVLDDVWSEDSARWEPLKNSLKASASPESRILLTTRKERVAMVMGSRSVDIVSVECLSEDGCWKLFTHLAFFERPSWECKNLEDIGRRIVGKCKGLPLAVKTIGSLLRFKKSKEQWQSVLDSEMWEIKEVEEGVFLPLLVSYYDLPSVLRQCFLFCAVFPEDYVIKKDELIKMWMAHGFLNEVVQNKEMEMVGEESFIELAVRSFFQDFEKNENGDIVGCKMHDLVHAFARFLTKKECLLVKVDRLEETREVSLPSMIRHSFLLMGENAKFPILMNNWEKARTLLVQSNWRNSGKRNLLNSIDKLVSLRILRFVEGQISRKVGKLIHLRYLNLSNNEELKTLPEALCDLYNLQTLDISRCIDLRRLPRGIGKLKNLRYLENEDTRLDLLLPKGLKRLNGLRIIREINLSTKKSAFKIGDLANFSNLQGCLTEIRGLERAEAREVRAAQLSTKISHRDLNLYFYGGGKRDNRNEAVVLDALEPPPLLENLGIWNSRGPTLFPSWMTSLTMLKTLHLYSCYNWERLPPLGKLLSLQYLSIRYLSKVKKVGEEFSGIEREEEASSSIIAFPNLKELLFQEMYKLEDWECGNLFSSTDRGGGITIMPLLRSLRIDSCPNLKALPHHLFPNLEKLWIYGCPILSRRYEVRRGEDWPYISHIPQRDIEDPWS